MRRREFLDWLAVSTAVTATAAAGGCVPGGEPTSPVAPMPPVAPKANEGTPPVYSQRTLQIGMLVYPRFTALDLIGPQAIFAQLSNTQVHLVWKTLDPVTSDSGITITPTRTFQSCPQTLDVLFVPGGTFGTVDMMKDLEVHAFLQSRAATATWVTSVCTGSLVLGAAGLLRGYQATTHWVARDVLDVLEAIPVAARYVEDRNRITGAGISAGIDFGLRLAEKLRTPGEAQGIELNLEYAPEPPYPGGGSPATAPASIVSTLETRYVPFLDAASAAADAAAAGFP
jgi:cyclohexyl-isocyanide hydratase